MPFCKRLLKASALKRRPVGDLTRFGFFRLLRGYSRRLLPRKLLPFGMFMIVLMTMDTADYTEYELTLKLKPFFLLLLCYAPLRVLLVVVCGQQLLKFSNFQEPILKYLKNFCPLSFRRLACEIFFFPSKTHYESSIFGLLAFLLTDG